MKPVSIDQGMRIDLEYNERLFTRFRTIREAEWFAKSMMAEDSDIQHYVVVPLESSHQGFALDLYESDGYYIGRV